MGRTTARPGLKDIAGTLGLSISTVSRALNGHPSVSDALRQQVADVAEQMGYRNGATSSPRIEQVAFAVREGMGSVAVNPFYSHVLSGAEAECHRRGIKLFYRTVPEGERGIASIAEMAGPGNGILLVGHFDVDFQELRLRCPGPFVVVDNHVPELHTDSVLAANRDGIRLAVRHLYNRGHRKFALLGMEPHYTLNQRFRGFREVLVELGAPFDPKLVVPCDLNTEGGYQATTKLLQALQANRPTALLCTCDAVAVGALRAAAALGLQVPRDLAVVGFDDIDMAAHVTPTLTTVRVPKAAMGAMGVRRLVERFAEPDLPATRTMLNAELIVRESS